MTTCLTSPTSLPKAKLLPGFRADSPGLFGPFEGKGFCLPEFVRPGKVVHVWFDFDAEFYSGDVVGLFMLCPNGSIVVKGKRAELTRDGRLWFYCFTTPDHDPEKMMAYPSDSPLLRILAVAPIVAELERPGVRDPLSMAGSLEASYRYGHICEPALKEWREKGPPPRTRIQHQNHPWTVAKLRKELQ